MGSVGGIYVLGGGGLCKPKVKRLRPPGRGRLSCATASTRRCWLSGGERIPLRQSTGGYRDARPFVTCLDESWAFKGEQEGKEGGSLAEAALAVGRGRRPLGWQDAFAIYFRRR